MPYLSFVYDGERRACPSLSCKRHARSSQDSAAARHREVARAFSARTTQEASSPADHPADLFSKVESHCTMGPSKTFTATNCFASSICLPMPSHRPCHQTGRRGPSWQKKKKLGTQRESMCLPAPSSPSPSPSGRGLAWPCESSQLHHSPGWPHSSTAAQEPSVLPRRPAGRQWLAGYKQNTAAGPSSLRLGPPPGIGQGTDRNGGARGCCAPEGGAFPPSQCPSLVLLHGQRPPPGIWRLPTGAVTTSARCQSRAPACQSASLLTRRYCLYTERHTQPPSAFPLPPFPFRLFPSCPRLPALPPSRPPLRRKGP